MINRFKEQNWRPSLAERRKFGFMLAAGMPLSALLWLGLIRYATGSWHWAVPLWILGAGGSTGLLIATAPSLGRAPYCVWYFLVCCIDTAVSTTLLSLMYYVVLTPVALVMRVIGRKPLQKEIQRARPSYWRTAEPPSEAARYFRQF